MNAARVLVTPRSLTASPHPAIGAIDAAGYGIVYSSPGVLPGEAELLRLVPGCIGWIVGVEPVSEAVIRAATELRSISRNGVGVDNLPVALLRERGIHVATAGGANASGVAELTLGLMLSALRHIPAADAGIKAGGWPRLRGRELGGRTLGSSVSVRSVGASASSPSRSAPRSLRTIRYVARPSRARASDGRLSANFSPSRTS